MFPGTLIETTRLIVRSVKRTSRWENMSWKGMCRVKENDQKGKSAQISVKQMEARMIRMMEAMENGLARWEVREEIFSQPAVANVKSLVRERWEGKTCGWE